MQLGGGIVAVLILSSQQLSTYGLQQSQRARARKASTADPDTTHMTDRLLDLSMSACPSRHPHSSSATAGWAAHCNPAGARPHHAPSTSHAAATAQHYCSDNLKPTAVRLVKRRGRRLGNALQALHAGTHVFTGTAPLTVPALVHPM
jgi:hypothetical protein